MNLSWEYGIYTSVFPEKVYQSAWWMASYGGLTPKRHIAYANTTAVKLLDLGTLLKEVRERLSKHRCQSSKTYTSKAGKKRFAGSRFLKQTQMLGVHFLKKAKLLEQLTNLFLKNRFKGMGFKYIMISMYLRNFNLKSPPIILFPSMWVPYVDPSTNHAWPRVGFETTTSPAPRIYPPRFAMRIASNFERFCASRFAAAGLCGDCMAKEVSAKDLFSRLGWDDHDTWSDAELAHVLVYLRGSTGLELGTWRELFPDTIPP